MNLLVTKYREEDGIYWGTVPQMPGIHTCGENDREFAETTKEMVDSWCEEISAGRASHTQLYPTGLECVKDFYMTESDPWAAIEKLSQEIEAGFYLDKFCADTELDLASQEIIKFSLEEAEELESDIMFMSV